MPVTPNFFAVLGVGPDRSAVPSTEEEDRAGAQVVVISYGLWQRRFGGDRGVGRPTVLMNGSRYEVIGVMPRGFVFRNRDVDYWVPIGLSPQAAAARNNHFLNVVARLAPGVSIEAAADDMRRIDAIASEGVSEHQPDRPVGRGRRSRRSCSATRASSCWC